MGAEFKVTPVLGGTWSANNSTALVVRPDAEIEEKDTAIEWPLGETALPPEKTTSLSAQGFTGHTDDVPRLSDQQAAKEQQRFNADTATRAFYALRHDGGM